MSRYEAAIGVHYSLFESMKELLTYVPKTGYVSFGFKPSLSPEDFEDTQDYLAANETLRAIQNAIGSQNTWNEVAGSRAASEEDPEAPTDKPHSELFVHCQTHEQAEQIVEVTQGLFALIERQGNRVEVDESIHMVGFDLGLFTR